MAYQKPQRNTDGIQWEGLRLATDLATAEMDDEVSEKYYDYWREGISSPWGPFDTVGDPAGDKYQFDLLCEMIHCMHTVMFHKINHQMYQDDPNDPRVISQDEYRYVDTRDPETGELVERLDMPALCRTRMNEITLELGVETSQMTDHYRQRVKDLAGYEFPDWSVP